MEKERPLSNESIVYEELNNVYDECINYLKTFDYEHDDIVTQDERLNNEEQYDSEISDDPTYETINFKANIMTKVEDTNKDIIPNTIYEVENEIDSHKDFQDSKEKLDEETHSDTNSISNVAKSERLRKLSQQLPKIVITQSDYSLNVKKGEIVTNLFDPIKEKAKTSSAIKNNFRRPPQIRKKTGYGDYPKRLVSKNGSENIALIANVPFANIRLLNDAFHTLINLRWRWIVSGTMFLHFALWLIFAAFWYITALAHYDFEPNPPEKTCITGGKDFITIFLAAVEAQTTIGFGDRAIDEECPESVFLFVIQLILATGLSGVLTCVVYAKITRPEKLSKDGVGFSRRAVISLRDGKLCLMMRVWDLNHDHIINSEFTAHFVNTHRTKEREVVRYYARPISLQQKQFLLWPLILVHVIDETSPLYTLTPELIASTSYEIVINLKGASASMGTFTQSQSSYLPREILWGHRFLPVVSYNNNKMKYVINHKLLHATEPVATPCCSASQMESSLPSSKSEPTLRPGSPGSFSDRISSFRLERSSSFRKKEYHH